MEHECNSLFLFFPFFCIQLHETLVGALKSSNCFSFPHQYFSLGFFCYLYCLIAHTSLSDLWWITPFTTHTVTHWPSPTTLLSFKCQVGTKEENKQMKRVRGQRSKKKEMVEKEKDNPSFKQQSEGTAELGVSWHWKRAHEWLWWQMTSAVYYSWAK